jgi:hypothetical protein
VLIHVPHDAPVLAMDVHRTPSRQGLLEPGATSPVVDNISTDDESVRRLVARFADPRRVCVLRGGPDGLRAGPGAAQRGDAL